MSRRGLLGIFGVGARGFRDALEREASNLSSASAQARPPRPAIERKLRAADETVVAWQESLGEWSIDFRARKLEVGRSWRAVGEGLAEPLLVARVSATHVAAVAGECSVDGSDLLWLAFEDRVACPACGSRWRLDGAVARGPADSPLASFVVEETDGVVRVRAR
jgi:Rieske Fe-S protein